MKKILSMVLAVIIAAGSVTAYAVEVENGGTVAMADGAGDSFIEGDLGYTVLEDGTLSVGVAGGNTYRLTTVTIPSEINGKRVTSIRDSAFYYCTNLTSVTIPNGVTSIGDKAFINCTSLTTVTIPDSVTSIGNYAFNGCEGLTSVTIPDSITSIGLGVFFNCTNLTLVTIPDSVTSIDSLAFSGCESLASVTIPEGVTSIGNFAFNGCTSLTSVTIPDSVTSIGDEAFSACTGLTTINVEKENKNYYSENGVLFNKERTTPKLITYPAGKTDNSYAIPDGVGWIESFAFRGCTSLTSVTIPDSVTWITDRAFYGCTSLTEINVGEENKNYCSENGVLYNKNKTKLIAYPTSKKDNSYAIPDGVTSIGDFLFEGCKNLVSVTIPDSVKGIGTAAFKDCTSLTTVTIPDSVTSIVRFAFDGCTSLTAINVGKENKNYCSENGILFDKDKTTLITYPAGKTNNSYAIPESVTSIISRAFKGCTSLAFVTIPDGITSIEFDAFNDCTSLASVTIPNSVTSIRANAFKGCTNLKDIYYSGTEEEWGKIDISVLNEPLTTATIHYNSIGPDSVQIDIAKPESGNAPDTSGMKVEIGGEKPQTITISADGKLDLSGMADGKYSFTFSANNCAPRKYSVTVLNGTASGLDGGVELHLYGDISGDGKITNSDVLKANASSRKTKALEGYDLNVADINGDGKITNADVLKMNAHSRNTTMLW